MRAYVAMQLKKDITVAVLGMERTVPFDYLDGLVGVMLVFNSIESARDYADGEIVEVEVYEKLKEAKNG